jgi:hypothetical protein
MATAPQAADVLQALEGHALFTAKVPFEGVPLSGCPEFLDIGIAEVLDTGVRVHTRLRQDPLGAGETDPVDVSEGNFDPLVAGNVDAGDPSHVG